MLVAELLQQLPAECEKHVFFLMSQNHMKNKKKIKNKKNTIKNPIDSEITRIMQS